MKKDITLDLEDGSINMFDDELAVDLDNCTDTEFVNAILKTIRSFPLDSKTYKEV